MGWRDIKQREPDVTVQTTNAVETQLTPRSLSPTDSIVSTTGGSIAAPRSPSWLSSANVSRPASTRDGTGGDECGDDVADGDGPILHENREQSPPPTPEVRLVWEHAGLQPSLTHIPTPPASPANPSPTPVTLCDDEHLFGTQTTRVTKPIPQRLSPTQPTQTPWGRWYVSGYEADGRECLRHTNRSLTRPSQSHGCIGHTVA